MNFDYTEDQKILRDEIVRLGAEVSDRTVTIKAEHDTEAKTIGEDSWSLVKFDQLPKRASVREQVEALAADQQWQQHHTQYIDGRIDALKTAIDPERKFH